jgi:Ca-activated chloride channel family protein
MYMAFDETTLKAIAEATRAAYFHASTADELVKVYDALTARLQLERERTEVTALLAAAGAAIVLAAGALSIAWFSRIV